LAPPETAHAKAGGVSGAAAADSEVVITMTTMITMITEITEITETTMTTEAF
jgi:hypothetical protein